MVALREKAAKFLAFAAMLWSGLAGPTVSAEEQQVDVCVDCHAKESPGIVAQWRGSKHGETGVFCADCHGAREGDPDAFGHYDATIAIIVSPKDCAPCHREEYLQQKGSHHAKAGQILGSLDNLG
ncbi:MAG: multiheme c-type cytochrome [Planctomycetota bacterium]|jgi:hypothetical protein